MPPERSPFDSVRFLGNVQQNMGKFNPDFYREYRPFYPAQTFEGLSERLGGRGFSAPYAVADVGCGTGHSAMSLLRSGLNGHVTGVDPDPGMLEEARRLADREGFADRTYWLLGTGEATTLPAECMDVVLVGSAFHWMRAAEARDEILRILKRSGLVRIFEYQFPKAKDLPELNEWVRRQFNLFWKAPGQKPRGDFQDVTAVFHKDVRFAIVGTGRPEMRLELDHTEFTGLLLSQSRVLHYEATLPDSERERFRRDLSNGMQERFATLAGRKAAFDFKLQWVEFAVISKAR